jgi:hypothetical protein
MAFAIFTDRTPNGMPAEFQIARIRQAGPNTFPLAVDCEAVFASRDLLQEVLDWYLAPYGGTAQRYEIREIDATPKQCCDDRIGSVVAHVRERQSRQPQDQTVDRETFEAMRHGEPRGA